MGITRHQGSARLCSGPRLLAIAAAAVLITAACGGDDGASNGGAGGDQATEEAGPPSRHSLELLSEDDQERLNSHISEFVSRRVTEEQSVDVPNFHYGPFERLVTGFVPDGWDLLESCQEMLDLIAVLDGPPGTVPVRVIRYVEGGGGEYEVRAWGPAGGTCAEL